MDPGTASLRDTCKEWFMKNYLSSHMEKDDLGNGDD